MGTRRLSLIARGRLIGATPRGQPWTSAVTLPHRRNGLRAQAHTLDWQVRTAVEAGSAGTFVFAWTDEWHRGGHEIDDWDFGLTDRERRAKPALAAVASACAAAPFGEDRAWPRVSTGGASRYLAMVGTRVRDRRYDASIAKITASASGTKR